MFLGPKLFEFYDFSLLTFRRVVFILKLFFHLIFWTFSSKSIVNYLRGIIYMMIHFLAAKNRQKMLL